MGALLVLSCTDSNTEVCLRKSMVKRGFTEQCSYIQNDYQALLYKRMSGSDSRVAVIDNCKLLLHGTMVYRGLDCRKSCHELLMDLINNRVNEEELLGHFVAVAMLQQRIVIITDRLMTVPLYYHEGSNTISTSFLALSELISRPLELNKQAIFEIIFGQGSVPPDTQLQGITQIVPEYSPVLPGLQIFKYKDVSYGLDSNLSYNMILEQQIERLDSYFDLTRNALISQGQIIGLTGGFDSRLLYAMLKRHGLTPKVYTHWQEGKSKDFVVAMQIAAQQSLNLNWIDKHKKNEHAQTALLFEGYNYTDGQCRSQYYWTEVYSTFDYLRELNQDSFCSLNGVGGEQYRNNEGIHVSVNSWHKWLQTRVFQSACSVLPKSAVIELIDNHISKISRLIPIEDKPSPLTIKMYANRVYGYANRYFRAGFEVQVFDHLSPFCDPYISLYAYKCVPHLGNLFEFQKRLIYRIDPELASIVSNYGFSFNKPTPLTFRMGKSILYRMPFLKRWIGTLKPDFTPRFSLATACDPLKDALSTSSYSRFPVDYQTDTLLMQLDYYTKNKIL